MCRVLVVIWSLRNHYKISKILRKVRFLETHDGAEASSCVHHLGNSDDFGNLEGHILFTQKAVSFKGELCWREAGNWENQLWAESNVAVRKI